MSTNVMVPKAVPAVANGERAHRLWLNLAYLLAAAIALALAVYGLDYYWLSQAQRALSAKHALLKPSGTIGLRLGMFGALLFFAVYVYPLRKHWAWLGRQGNSRHWLDFHVLLGLTAPVIITFHSSFKFRGLAGVAYWIMVAVAMSGVAGRYIYAQIPRTLSSAEMSFKEAQEQSAKLAAQLSALGVLSARDVAALMSLPDVRGGGLLSSLAKMVFFDLVFPLRVWRLRQKMLWSHSRSWSLVGLGRSQNAALERAVATAREQTLLTKKILFLSTSHRLFHLWHVIHRPFSYSFALLASVHIVLMLMLGYY